MRAELLELAAKCRNPVMRNALLAVAASGRGEELADRLARAEIREAAAVGRETRLAQERIFRAADAAGARGRGDPRFVNPTLAEYAVMADADFREADARKARKALRAMRTGG